MAKTKKSKGTSASELPFVINGWHIYAHPLFLDQFERLTARVADLKRKQPGTYKSSADAKVLAGLYAQAFLNIPQDPAREEYRQGGTLGPSHKHWFRAKFGGERLFFRYNSARKVILLAWVNDENSLRTYGSKTDAYAAFRRMLDSGNPPGDWAALEKECLNPSAAARLKKAATGK